MLTGCHQVQDHQLGPTTQEETDQSHRLQSEQLSYNKQEEGTKPTTNRPLLENSWRAQIGRDRKTPS